MICKRLRELKDAKNLTNRELSDLSGVPLGTVNHIMSHDTANPGIDTVLALCSALGTTVDTLLGISPPGAAADQRLIESYEHRLDDKVSAMRYRSRWIRALFILCLCQFLFIIIWLIIDILNPNIGWLQS